MRTVDIWIGNFPDEATFRKYFEEQYDDDDAPLSAFAKDQGVGLYDSAWLEASFQEKGSFADLLQDQPYSAQYGSELSKKTDTAGLDSANSFVMASSEEIPAPRSVDKPNYQLFYMGRFDGAV